VVEGRLLLSVLSFLSRLHLVSSIYPAILLYTRRLSPGTLVLVFLNITFIRKKNGLVYRATSLCRAM
jgi:hypothetical protein